MCSRIQTICVTHFITILSLLQWFELSHQQYLKICLYMFCEMPIPYHCKVLIESFSYCRVSRVYIYWLENLYLVYIMSTAFQSSFFNFVKLSLDILFFWGYLNCFLNFILDSLLQVCSDAIDFCILSLYPATLLNILISFQQCCLVGL